MRVGGFIGFLVAPSCLRTAVAQEAYVDLHDLDDAIYESGFHQAGQDLLGNLPCPDYTRYATQKHQPLSEGPLKLPYQRPHKSCRKFTSPEVEQVIQDLYPRLKDRDLAHIFQNAFPNTLDTTVLWHVDGESSHAEKSKYMRYRDAAQWKGAQSFIVTGDINAEWLRDSTNQLAQYQVLAKTAPDISNLIKGAIATQAEFVIESPYCNAFQPPSPSGLEPSNNGQQDTVHPIYEPSNVFECKYELDSLANFLSLGNQYHAATGFTTFLTTRWFLALRSLLETLYAQSQPTFDSTHTFRTNEYAFQRVTSAGTETLNLQGIGNPIGNISLIRSAFRPSDDATILPYLIPSNAMISVELSRTATLLRTFSSTLPSKTPEQKTDKQNVQAYVHLLETYATSIRAAILKHGTTIHPIHGRVFAYETDGYASHILMDDANMPSLLSLPLLGFLDLSLPDATTFKEIYSNTRRLVLSPSNPYYLSGPYFSGIGGPHIGLRNAWPMSALVQAMTSDDPTEIKECLERVKNVSVFGLINESVDVRTGVDRRTGNGMTRSWFAWANSVFAQCVIWLAREWPELVFEDGREKYVVGEGFVKV